MRPASTPNGIPRTSAIAATLPAVPLHRYPAGHAFNRLGETQPLDPLWNPAGYLRNVVETTTVKAV